MTALEKIFDGYYDERLDDEKPDPEEMSEVYGELLEAIGSEELLEKISIYGREAEKTGFFAGFRMAWELLKNMQGV